MSLIDRLWRRLSGGDQAERAESSGDLALAARLWVASGAVDEAARVMLLRGDAEQDPEKRLAHYTQAAAIASADSAVQTAARVKRAKLIVALAEGGALSGARRRDVIEAAMELEKGGEAVAAAEAYALACDTEGEARALTLAGDVERLEALLTRDQTKRARTRSADDVHAEIDALVGAGRRREALALGDAWPDDAGVTSRMARVRGARTEGPVVRLLLRGHRLVVVLGAEVTVGRSEGAITVASSALSRRHVQLTRDPRSGSAVARDLGSRNGTLLRGLRLATDYEVSEATTLVLGGEVPLILTPGAELSGALGIEVGGDRYVAPLAASGDALLGVGGWRLAQASDGWVELVSDAGSPAYVGELLMAPRVTLMRGDAIAAARSGEVLLRVE